VSTFKDLLTTDYGLMSAGVIVFILGMAVFLARFVQRHMDEDERRARRS